MILTKMYSIKILNIHLQRTKIGGKLKQRFSRKIRVIMFKLKGSRDVLIALFFDLLEVLPGFISVQILSLAEKTPWLLAIIPILLTVRGSTSGIFIGNITTFLHLGIVKPLFKGNTREYYTLVVSIFLFSVANSILATIILSIAMMKSLKELEIVIVLFLLALAFPMSTLFSLITTSFVSFLSYKKGIDPDIVVYPIMSVANDIAIIYILYLSAVTIEPWQLDVAITRGIIPFIIVMGCSVYLVIRFRKEPLLKRIFRESYLGVFFSLILSSVTGVILAEAQRFLIVFPSILCVLPGFMSFVGDMGSIVASTFTTKLAVGKVHPGISSSVKHLANIFSMSFLPCLAVLLTLSTLATLLTKPSEIVFLFTFSVLVTAAAFSVILVGFLAVTVAWIAFAFGINPDNICLPIVTSVADFLSAFSVLFIARILIAG